MAQQYHPYHLIEPSPYPYFTAFSALGLTTGSAMYFHSFNYGGTLALFSLTSLIISVYS